MTKPDAEERRQVADGTLGNFATVAGVNLTVGRYRYTLAITGNSLYALGGMSVSSIDRATINADGSIATFAVVPGVTVPNSGTPRKSHTSAVIGNKLYTLGGYTGAYVNTISRATGPARRS